VVIADVGATQCETCQVAVNMVFFWACEVTETKAAVVKVPENYVLNVCNATLASVSDDIVSVGLETTQMDQKPWKGVVAHLGKGAAHQVKLDLVFGLAPQIKFYVAKGTGKVNLTGYFQPGPPSDLFELDAEVGVAKPAAVEESSKAADKPQNNNKDKKNKKRAREETKKAPAAPVTWDQAESSDESEETSKPETKVVAKSSPAKQQQQQPKKDKSMDKAENKAPVNAASSEDASGKKKKNKKRRRNANAANGVAANGN
ncbi:TPA: hypothetical protein N0F65_000073, partial [Lagenidium giganteum]